MDDPGGPSSAPLDWTNVAFASLFILFNATLSLVFQLDVGSSLVTAATRCVIQLSVMAMVLGKVFETNNPWGVAAIAATLNVLGAFETVYSKSSRRYSYMYPTILSSMTMGTIPVSLLGSRFAMGVEPFWRPEQYIPIVGMLCGSAISGMVVAVTYILRELHDNRDKVEMYLAFGASRLEACRTVAQEALRLALLPSVNQMSVVGLISIPGMMTGAILGGSPVNQAAKLQMVIMFMISASTALSVIAASVVTLSTVVDKEHRIRLDRMTSTKPLLWKWRDAVLGFCTGGVLGIWRWVFGAISGCNKGCDCCRRVRESGEREPLLG